MNLLRNCVGVRVLEYFLAHPNQEIYLRQLSLKLKISISSAKIYCDDFLKEGLVLEQRKGNLRLFRLNREDFAAKKMILTYQLMLLRQAGLNDVTKGSASLAIYGSYAAGNFNERSDLDILVVGEEADVNRDQVLRIQESIDRQIQLTVLPHLDWARMKKRKDRFVESILCNHVLIKGEEL
jgi:uncharacterized protein